MKLKTILIATIVLLALAALFSFFGRSDGAPKSDDPRVGQTLTATEDLRALSALEIAAQDGDTVRVQLSDDGRWMLPAEGGVPADIDRLRRAVTPLTEARIDRFVTARAERKEGLDLERVHLKLEGAGGKTFLDLKVGRAASVGGNYVEFAGDENVYRIDQSLTLDTTPGNWVDRTPLGFEPDAVKAITLAFPAESSAAPITISRASAGGDWTTKDAPEGTTIKDSDLSRLLRNLGTLRATRHVARTDPEVVEAEAFMRTITVKTFEGATYTVRLGRRPEKTLPAAPAAEGDKGEAEPKTEPAGKVFVEIAYDHTKSDWAPVADQYAFEIAEWAFNQLPGQPSALLTFPTPVVTPTPPEISPGKE